MLKTSIKISLFKEKALEKLEKGPTLAEGSESLNGNVILIQTASLWLFQGQCVGNRRGSQRSHHLPAISNQKLLLFVRFWGTDIIRTSEKCGNPKGSCTVNHADSEAR